MLTSSSVPTPDPSLWDRISTWASEHKAVVYTIAGVTVVATAAGAIYYFSDSGKATQEPAGGCGGVEEEEQEGQAES